MIIELFGPPAVGKTTFASALTARLRERGCVVELIQSYRPAEHAPSLGSSKGSVSRQTTAVVRRLTRPVVEMLATARYPSANGHDTGTAANLMKILPPKNILWSIRLRQYLARLCHCWQQASVASHIVLFDQAFVQAVCSLALLGRRADGKLVVLLEAVPKPDLLIRLDAPQEVLSARLRERERLQSRIERLLEFDLTTNLKSAQVIEDLHDLLGRRGQSVTCVESADERSLSDAVDKVEREVMARLRNERGERLESAPAAGSTPIGMATT